MIIFYNKDGSIAGTIEGRIHSEQHLKMWIGEKGETERIVINWKPIEGTQDFEPDCNQKDIFITLDKNPSDIFKYKVDVATKKLIIK